MNDYTSKFWYWGKICFSVYQRFGAYISFGVHIGRDIELHLLWWILMLMPAEKGRELQEADRYCLEGIEPDEST